MRIYFILVWLLLVPLAQAGSYSTNGTVYYPTWNDPDNKTIPDYELDISSGKWPYLVEENSTHMLFTVSDNPLQIDQVAIPKLNMTFDYQPFKVSPRLTYPKSVLLNNMVSVNATVAYLSFPYSLSRVKDWADEHNIHLGRWHFDNNMLVYDDNETVNYLPISAYELHVNVVSDDIRLYFLKSEANKLQGNITFQMQSWTVNGSTTPRWINSTLVNISNQVCGNNLELNDTLNDFTSKWSGNNCALDQNTTTNNNGTLKGNASYVLLSNGKYAFNFNGTSGNVTLGTISPIVKAGVYSVQFKINITSMVLGYALSQARSTTDVLVIGTTAGGSLVGSHYNGATFARKASAVSTNTDYFVTYTYNNHVAYLYINEINATDTTAISTETNTGTRIGSSSLGANPINAKVWDMKIYPYALTRDQHNTSYATPKVSNGSITAWYNSGTGNETYQIDVNATTPTNTNYTVWYANNGTGSYTQLDGTLTGNNSLTISGTKYQNTDVQVRLTGNQTATPEIIQLTFFDQAVSGAAGDFVPPEPTGCTSTNGTTWINLSCSAGVGNTTDGMNFTNVNTTAWSNGTAFYWNNTGLTSSTSYTYHIYGFNSSGNGTLSLTYATLTDTTQATPTPTPTPAATAIPNCDMVWTINNTNLAPTIHADHPGTGERIDNTTYWANSSSIELHVFAHADNVSETAGTILYINGTIVSRRSGRPLGAAEAAYRGVDTMIPKGSYYQVDFENYHHYEWYEYTGVLDISGCETQSTSNDDINVAYGLLGGILGSLILLRIKRRRKEL